MTVMSTIGLEYRVCVRQQGHPRQKFGLGIEGFFKILSYEAINISVGTGELQQVSEQESDGIGPELQRH